MPEAQAPETSPGTVESPTTQEAPAKAKKPTPTQVKAELTDLQEVAGKRLSRIRDLEVLNQRTRDILKRNGTPGATLVNDHYRLQTQIDELRKLHDVQDVQLTHG